MSADKNLPTVKGNYQLPTLEELIIEKELTGQLNEFNKLLNQPPPAKWLVPHPLATKEIINGQGQKEKVPIDYLPIARVEYLLTRIYTTWKPEIREVKLIANSVQVTVRLHVLNPVTSEWEWSDGVGAVPLQTDKGAGATEFDKIKANAVQIGAPAAKSYAIKDAAECFGKIFGKDLNRNYEMDYQPMQEAKSNALGKIPDELAAVIEDKETVEELDELYKANAQFHANRDFITRLKQRRGAIAKKEETHE